MFYGDRGDIFFRRFFLILRFRFFLFFFWFVVYRRGFGFYVFSFFVWNGRSFAVFFVGFAFLVFLIVVGWKRSRVCGGGFAFSSLGIRSGGGIE